MKCMKMCEQIRRVNEDEVSVLLKEGWVFAKKSEWKGIKSTSKEEIVIEKEVTEVSKGFKGFRGPKKDNSRGKDRKRKHSMEKKKAEDKV